MTIDDNKGGGSFQKTQNQYDVIYVQPLIVVIVVVVVAVVVVVVAVGLTFEYH